MQINWLEDFVALCNARSFARAAEERNVTRPAFGRRIAALESWVGAPLLSRKTAPVALTVAGEELLEYARDVCVRGQDLRHRAVARGGTERGVRIVSGRTTARTLVADLLAHALRQGMQGIHILSRDMRDAVGLLEAGQTDFLLSFVHPLVEQRLAASRFSSTPIADDALVPVTACNASGQPAFEFSSQREVPLLDYSAHLLLHRMVREMLARLRRPPRLLPVTDCDAPDALHAYALRALGVAWLPASMVAQDRQRKLLLRLGNRTHEVPLQVRLYRSKQRLNPQAEAFWQIAQRG